jgi:putative RecB family exonuclease
VIALITDKPVEERTIPQLLESVSASRLSTFHQCRLKFFFRYVVGIKKRPSTALVFGKIMHALVQVWNLARWRGEKIRPPEEIVRALCLEAKNEELNPESIVALFDLYRNEVPIPADEKPLGVEVSLEADLSQKGLPKLIGILDLVRPKGVIVDLKTSSTTPNPQNVGHLHELQLLAYSVLYRESTGEKESGLELHHLVKTKAPKLVISQFEPFSGGREDRLYRAIDSYVDGLEKKDFVPSPGMGCLSCEFINECRKWPNKP